MFTRLGFVVEPLLIEPEPIDITIADIRQNFVAIVVKDEDPDTILVVCRYTGETSVSRYVMMPVAGSSIR